MPAWSFSGALGACLLAGLAGAPETVAAVHAVAPGGDVQAALDAAAPGDVVLLQDGVHPMPAGLVMRNGVALEGESRDGAILDGGLSISDVPADNHVVFGIGIDDPRTRVSNLTVTGAHSLEGGAFRVRGADAGEISGNRIHANFASDLGSAIYVLGSVPPAFRIAFNLIHDNADSTPTGAHAIDVRNGAEPTIQNNTLAFNDDNGIFASGGWPLVVNNILFRNGTDLGAPVVLDPVTLEPVSGHDDNVGRGSCYVTPPPAPGVRISHNLFFGNQSAALLVSGPNAGDYEDPRDVEPLEGWIVGSRHVPRGAADGVLFLDAAARDLRIVPGSEAWLTGDPEVALSQGVLHIGAEQPALPSVPGVAPEVLAAALLLAAFAVGHCRGAASTAVARTGLDA